ncbi:carbonyl reductase [NADPH] 3-like [Maniola hyperantus]|uniref:carbonyl reductase [NADPH] 3-like n=1 Tax=Aphantopus hyperantus TaxID=2795564 RepID=UPI001568140C|nr:carbonyl reductase [NADPH] 3-like [Maniola hyperantus]
MTDKVAVVTGSNKGIGYGVVTELCRRGVGTVYLTARDIHRGHSAVEKLKRDGLDPKFHQLDVTDTRSVEKFANHLKEKHGGLDILINNAAIIQQNITKTTYEEAKQVIDVNYKSLFIIDKYLFPLLKENARVINISSDLGHISNLKNNYWINRLSKDDIEVQDVDDFIDWFLSSVKNGTLKEEDFAVTAYLAYRVSKIAVCALTRVQYRKVGRNIAINSLHPGFVKTDMTQNNGFMTVEQSCKAPVYLALDCDQSVKGKFIWFDKSERDWTDRNMDLLCTDKETVQKYVAQLISKS